MKDEFLKTIAEMIGEEDFKNINEVDINKDPQFKDYVSNYHNSKNYYKSFVHNRNNINLIESAITHQNKFQNQSSNLKIESDMINFLNNSITFITSSITKQKINLNALNNFNQSGILSFWLCPNNNCKFTKNNLDFENCLECGISKPDDSQLVHFKINTTNEEVSFNHLNNKKEKEFEINAGNDEVKNKNMNEICLDNFYKPSASFNISNNIMEKNLVDSSIRYEIKDKLINRLLPYSNLPSFNMSSSLIKENNLKFYSKPIESLPKLSSHSFTKPVEKMDNTCIQTNISSNEPNSEINYHNNLPNIQNKNVLNQNFNPILNEFSCEEIRDAIIMLRNKRNSG